MSSATDERAPFWRQGGATCVIACLALAACVAAPDPDERSSGAESTAGKLVVATPVGGTAADGRQVYPGKMRTWQCTAAGEAVEGGQWWEDFQWWIVLGADDPERGWATAGARFNPLSAGSISPKDLAGGPVEIVTVLPVEVYRGQKQQRVLVGRLPPGRRLRVLQIEEVEPGSY